MNESARSRKNLRDRTANGRRWHGGSDEPARLNGDKPPEARGDASICVHCQTTWRKSGCQEILGLHRPQNPWAITNGWVVPAPCFTAWGGYYFCTLLFGNCARAAKRLVAVAQLVERQVVVLDVAGSNPVGHPESKPGITI